MGIFFEKPTKGPDAVGGIWPIRDRGRMWNRSGDALAKGDVVQLALTPITDSTEIATNDSNSYIPGRSNDTVWNTVVTPRSSTAQGSSIERGGIWGVVLDDVISDNKAGWVQFFGIVEDARCIKTGSDHAVSGDPLTVTTAYNFDGVINSNESVVAMYLDTQTGLTNRTLRRVFLHNGLLFQTRGQSGATAQT
jgi:hypothetical protein